MESLDHLTEFAHISGALFELLWSAILMLIHVLYALWFLCCMTKNIGGTNIWQFRLQTGKINVGEFKIWRYKSWVMTS